MLFGSGPVNIEWAAKNAGVDAILHCFFPAQAAGGALFRVLTNNGSAAVPAARLPFTWSKSFNDVSKDLQLFEFNTVKSQSSHMIIQDTHKGPLNLVK